MKTVYKNGQTSIIERVKILDSTTGAGKTGLTFSSSGLIISTIADNEATATAYTAAGSTIETITTLGTFAAPTATKCRFKEVDSTNHKGLYEIQIADARWAVSNAKKVIISIQCTGCIDCDAEVQLWSDDPYVAKPSNFASMALDGSGRVTVGSIVNGAIAAATFAANALDAVWSTATRVLTAGTNIVLAKGTGVTGFNDLSDASVQSDVQTALTAQGYTTTRAGYLDTLNGLVQAIWDKATSDLTTVGSVGKRIADFLTGDAYARLGAPSGASTAADIAAINAKTANIPASPAAVGSAMTLTAAYDAAKTAAQAGNQMDLVSAPNATAVTAIQSGLATSANQTTILNRIGAFTGSGLNTILGFLRALLRKDAALTPSDVGGTFDNTTDSVQAIRDQGDSAWGGGGGGGASAAQVLAAFKADDDWQYLLGYVKHGQLLNVPVDGNGTATLRLYRADGTTLADIPITFANGVSTAWGS